MKVTLEMPAPRQAVLTIELEPKEIEPYLERAYRGFAQRLSIPGFRPGKAPRNLVERLVGQEALMERAIDILAPEVTSKAVKEQNLPLTDAPRVEVVSRSPLTLKATVPLEPVVDLNNYQSLRIPMEPVQVTEQDVQRALEGLRRRYASWEPVARSAQVGDMLVLSLVGTAEGRQVFQEGEVPLILGESGFPLGEEFGERMKGASRGEVREFTLPIPADFPTQDLRGKPCTYRVLVKDVRAQRLPDLDDAFAQRVDPALKSLEALKARLKERLQQEMEDLQRERYRRQALDALRKQAKVEVPPLLVEREVEHTLEHIKEDLTARGLTLQRWLEGSGKTLEQVREELYPQAERRVEEQYLLDELAKAENIQVSAEEIDAELRSLASRSQRQDRELLRGLQEPAGQEAVARIIARRKALQRLVQIASQPVEAGGAPPTMETPIAATQTE
ncbi:MAG: trigger factor [Dehalococcoidia bacterium]